MKKPLIAIVGGETLLGREIRDVLAGSPKRAEIKLLGALDEGVGILTEREDEPTFISPLEQQGLEEATVLILAGSPATSRKVIELLTGLDEPPVVVDCTAVLEDQPAARLRAPLAEPESSVWPAGTIHLIAHPAATALALFLRQLQTEHAIRQSIVHVFEPASERGQAGIDELQRQTVSLLSFKTLPKDVYDSQAAFNMLARFGEDAKESLQAIQARLERHLASLLAQPAIVPMPSLRLIQAPVFHGYTFSVWVEFDQPPSTAALAELLDTSFIEIRGDDLEAPTNVGVAGQSGLAVGAIEPDTNNRRALWFWIAADNLRITADNAAMVARSELAGGGTA